MLPHRFEVCVILYPTETVDLRHLILVQKDGVGTYERCRDHEVAACIVKLRQKYGFADGFRYVRQPGVFACGADQAYY